MLRQTHPDMTVFNTTKYLTVSDLTENVIKLVEDALPNCTFLTSHKETEKAIPLRHLLVDKDVEHTFENGEV